MATVARLLVLEDHDDTLAVYVLVLESRGYQVIGCASIAEARERCRTESFDLLIADLELPDGNAIDVVRELGSCFAGKAIAISGHAYPQDIERSHAAGFRMHLIKPVRLEVLEDTVADLLAKQGLCNEEGPRGV